MNRRSFLAWLGAAPIAAPVAAKAVMAGRPAGSLARYAGAFIHFERGTAGVDILADGAVTSAEQCVSAMGASWNGVVATMEAERDRVSALGLAPGGPRVIPGSVAAGVWPRRVEIPDEATFLFVDDAGGGP